MQASFSERKHVKSDNDVRMHTNTIVRREKGEGEQLLVRFTLHTFSLCRTIHDKQYMNVAAAARKGNVA
jgi:hypothetical protein